MEDLWLIYFAMILLLGTLVSALANKLNVSNAFFLYFTGMVFGGLGLIAFPTETIISIGTLAIVFVVFESTVKLKFRDLTVFSKYSINIILFSYVLHMIFLTIAAFSLFQISSDKYFSFVLCLVFASLVYGIDHDITLANIKHKVVKVLEVESLINRFLTIVIPLILLNYLGSEVTTGLGVVLFFKHVVLGIVVGAVAGGLVLSILNTMISETLAYLVVLTTSIVTFVFTEAVGINGVLALTFYSLIFGNYHIKHKQQLEKFTFLFGYIFNIFVFILIGTKMLVKFEFVILGSGLFLLYILIRFISINLALFNTRFNLKEKIFMTLNVPKGIDVAIIVLLMMTKYSGFEGMATIVNLCLLFCLYSITIANVMNLFSKNLLSTS
jgi:cell volume regulation protein A